MKKAKIAVIMSVIVLSASLAAAQEEEGLIPRLIKRVKDRWAQKTAPQAPAPKAPAAQAAAPEQAPAVKPGTSAPQAAKAVPAEGSPTPVVKMSDSVKEMSKDELIKEIESEIDNEDAILDYLPSLKKIKEEGGKEYLAYNIDGKMLKLEELDRDKLESLLFSVYRQASLIQTERITSQLESIRQVENITRRANTVPPAPPPLPRVPQQPPRTPPSPPAEPRK